MDNKRGIRERLRKARRDHVAMLPDQTRALLFRRPPAALDPLIADDAVIACYHATPAEAPCHGYARWFSERGHPVALPWFEAADAPMRFRAWTDPWGNSDLEAGPYGALQPVLGAPDLVPTVLFVPLLGFTAGGARLGQGGGHYDRWLGDHREAIAIGLAWDVQRVSALPVEPHDRPLDAVVTPTRAYGPFEKDDDA